MNLTALETYEMQAKGQHNRAQMIQTLIDRERLNGEWADQDSLVIWERMKQDSEDLRDSALRKYHNTRYKIEMFRRHDNLTPVSQPKGEDEGYQVWGTLDLKLSSEISQWMNEYFEFDGVEIC